MPFYFQKSSILLWIQIFMYGNLDSLVKSIPVVGVFLVYFWCIFVCFNSVFILSKNSSHFWTKNDLAAVIMWFLLELKATFSTFFLKKLQLKKQFHSMFSFPAIQKVKKMLPNHNKKKLLAWSKHY